MRELTKHLFTRDDIYSKILPDSGTMTEIIVKMMGDLLSSPALVNETEQNRDDQVRLSSSIVECLSHENDEINAVGRMGLEGNEVAL